MKSVRRLLSIFSVVAALAGWVQPVQAGSGTFDAGVYNFCVSVRFNATTAELANIRAAFQGANTAFADALDGQQRWGTINIVNNSGCSETAEFWVNSGAGRAYATLGRYGQRGEHVMLWYRGQANGGADDMETGGTGVALTLAHEMAHHTFGVGDEYKGPGGAAHCAPGPDSTALSYSLMDNYFVRGGRSGGGTNYTVKEFCVKGNHDPDHLTDQSSFNNGQSVWETIAAHPTRSAKAPTAPSLVTPTVAAPIFQSGADGLRVIVVIDHSGSMADDNKLDYAKQAAQLYVSGLRTGDQVGVIAFDDTISTIFPLTTIGGPQTISSANAAIDKVDVGGSTDIGDALQSALSLITSVSSRSCNEMILLLTDGDYNVGPDPSTVAATIAKQGVTVLTVGVGSGISTGGQNVLASVAAQTGGKYYGLSSSFGLVSLFFNIWAESTGNGVIASSPLALAPNAPQSSTMLVEQGASEVSLGVAISALDASVSFVVTRPDGVQYASDAAVVAAGGSVRRNVASTVVYTFPNPQAGSWSISSASSVSTSVEVFGATVNNSTKLMVRPDPGEVKSPATPAIRATLQYKGSNLTGASVSGTVTRPDGSQVPITLADDGSTTSKDGPAADGVYGAVFPALNYNGTYTVALNATGNMTYAPGEGFGAPAPTPLAAPLLTRASSAYFVVTGIDACALPPTPIAMDSTVASSLATYDCALSGAYAKIYSFTATAGQKVAISLRSSDFDSYLYLVDSTLHIIATNDDGAGGQDSRIPSGSGLFTITTAGVYRIYASSYDEAVVGKFQLSLSSSGCSFTLNDKSLSFPAAGGTASIGVTASDASCARAATTDSAWISFSAGATGTGSGTVSLVAAKNPSAVRSGTLTIADQTVTVTQAATPPSFTASGMVNSATLVTGPVSPGELVSIFGAGIGPEAPVFFNIVNGAIPAGLSQTVVTFDGVPAPILFTSPTQVNLIVPYAVAGKQNTGVQVQFAGSQTSTISIPVAGASPGIFTLTQNGKGQGAIINADGTVNSASNPAARGSFIAMYGTGEGQSTPAGIDGQLALSSYPKPVLPVTATVGGQSARVVYAGAAPSLVAGVMQVNVEIPDSVAPGVEQLVVVVGSFSSPAGIIVNVK